MRPTSFLLLLIAHLEQVVRMLSNASTLSTVVVLVFIFLGVALTVVRHRR